MRRIKGTLHDDQYIFMIISRPFLLRMRNVSATIVEKMKTHILCSKTFFRKLCCLWNDVLNYNRTGQAMDESIRR